MTRLVLFLWTDRERTGIAVAQCLPSFDAPRRINVPERIVGAADFDGDGKPDLLASDGIGTNAIYLHGSQRVALPPDYPTSIMDVNSFSCKAATVRKGARR